MALYVSVPLIASFRPGNLGTLLILYVLYVISAVISSVVSLIDPFSQFFFKKYKREGLRIGGGGIGHLSEMLAESVRPSLQKNSQGSRRVLVYGIESRNFVANLVSTKEFPSKSLDLQGPNASEPNGLFWGEEPADLMQTRVPYDSILWTNVCPESVQETTALVQSFRSRLKPWGCLAGIGVFRDESKEGEGVELLDLRSFRNLLERCGYYVHVALDVTLEGKSMFIVRKSSKGTSPAFLGKGGVIYGRFLATLNPSSLPRVPSGSSLNLRVPSSPSLLDLAEPLPRVPSRNSLDLLSVSTLRKPIPRVLSSNSVSSLPRVLSSNSLTDFDLSSPRKEKKAEPSIVISSPTSTGPRLHEKRDDSKLNQIVITGVSLGLPNSLYPEQKVFDKLNFERLFCGHNFISSLSAEEKKAMLDQKPFMVFKKGGLRVEHKLTKDSEVVQLAGKIGNFSLETEYGVPSFVTEALDNTYQLAMAAGIEALKDAGIPVVQTTLESGKPGTKKIVGLPKEMQDETGVIFASSFPALSSLMEEAQKFYQETKEGQEEYQYNRKLLFKLLVMANGQLAELIKAKGPNMQINTACSGTTEAIALAEDWIKSKRCRRVVVVSSDNPTSKELLPYIGTGFLTLGAATVCDDVTSAAVPFDKRRKGMILGAGAVGLVIESYESTLSRSQIPKSILMGTHISNSAFHASMLNSEHISEQLNVFLKEIFNKYGLSKDELAKDAIYFSHETCTSACSKAEMDVLETSFGVESRRKLLITNTKAMTGHPMAVGVEDVMAVESLVRGKVPPVINNKERDPCLGDITLATPSSKSVGLIPLEDGSIGHNKKYALRFAAGFGSHFGFVLLKKWE